MSEISKLAWKGWIPFTAYRDRFGRHLHKAGLYAISKRKDRRVQFPSKSVVYFGETRNLRTRLRALERSALDGAMLHSGGMSMYDHQNFDLEAAFLAIRPTNLQSTKSKAWMMHEEARLLWRHAQRFDNLPLFNRKGQDIEELREIRK